MTSQMTSSAALSPDGLYRYSLSRVWGRGGMAMFIMLNPSTADANTDDPTIRRCVGFAKSWGCGGVRVVNLYALRSTDPKGLWRALDPVGPDNDHHLLDYANESSYKKWPMVAAWGANAKADRVDEVLNFPGMEALQCLGVTKAGQPRHPLYLRGDSSLSPWPA